MRMLAARSPIPLRRLGGTLLLRKSSWLRWQHFLREHQEAFAFSRGPPCRHSLKPVSLYLDLDPQTTQKWECSPKLRGNSRFLIGTLEGPGSSFGVSFCDGTRSLLVSKEHHQWGGSNPTRRKTLGLPGLPSDPLLKVNNV